MYDELVKRLRAAKAVVFKADDVDLLMQAADAIEELSKQLDDMNEANIALYGALPKWIPVTERLPETDDDVVVAFKNSKDGEWWYRIDNFVDGAFCYNAAFGRNITHWMPLPEPPTAEEGET